MYDPNLRERIRNDFKFHSATTVEKQNAHTSVRSQCLQTALFFEDHVPHGRELSLALTHLEEAMHWANAALAKENS
jgi:hypothetical protein